MNINKSNCCNYSIRVSGNITKHYQCESCLRPCDIATDNNIGIKTTTDKDINVPIKNTDKYSELEKRAEDFAQMFLKHTQNKTRAYLDNQNNQVGYKWFYNKILTLLQEQKQEIIKEVICKECDGTGVYQTPTMYDPCPECDGTGWNLSGCANDTLQLFKQEKQHETI